MTDYDYTDYEDSMNAVLKKVESGHKLVIECEEEMDEYFGQLEGMPGYSPIYVTKFYFTENGYEKRFACGLLDPHFWHTHRYVPVLEAVIKGLHEEFKWSESEGYGRYSSSLEEHIAEYQTQLDKLKDT